MKLNEILKEVERMYLINGYAPKSREEVMSKAVWLQSNIAHDKIRKFLDDIIQFYQFPKIFDFNRYLENNPMFKDIVSSRASLPSQSDPVKTWCRKCMNSGLIPIHRFVGWTPRDFYVKCDCAAAGRYPWMKATYREFYPDKMQFEWDPDEGDFYHDVYRRNVDKLIAEKRAKRRLAKLKGERVDEPVDYDEAIREDPVIARFVSKG